MMSSGGGVGTPTSCLASDRTAGLAGGDGPARVPGHRCTGSWGGSGPSVVVPVAQSRTTLTRDQDLNRLANTCPFVGVQWRHAEPAARTRVHAAARTPGGRG